MKYPTVTLFLLGGIWKVVSSTFVLKCSQKAERLMRWTRDITCSIAQLTSKFQKCVPVKLAKSPS